MFKLFEIFVMLWIFNQKTQFATTLNCTMLEQTTVIAEISKVNEVAELPCEANTNSTAIRTAWSGSEGPLPANFKKSKKSLTIENLRYVNSGVYNCTAHYNNGGCVISSSKLEIMFKIKEKNMVNQTAEVNSTAEFYCMMEMNPYTAANFTIFKAPPNETSDFKQLLMTLKERNIGHSPFYEIDKVQFEDEGWYTCVVTINDTNVVAHKSGYLQVIDPIENGWQPVTIALICVISVIPVILIVMAVSINHHKKLKNKYYDHWVKVVTITKQTAEKNLEGFQMPIVEIMKKRSLAVKDDNFECAPVMEYEFPIDWEWEFPRNRVTLEETLGEGAFGKVVLAVAHGLNEGEDSVPVAVKMLKNGHSDNDVKDLVCEMEVMKMIGKHPNIISLLGCCSRDGPFYVLVEYAVHGCLKDFLQEHHFENAKLLTNNQLVSFAHQIAFGMQHLSSMKCIHRDLAARNILVADGLVMKIADFGLARDVHNQEYYRKTTIGKLPIRWMAPESLEYRFFDTKSDVWSFGVLLWEIMTLGNNPYAAIPASENLLVFLKKGNRLEQPLNCSNEIYRIMIECWQYKPENRPSFEELVSAFKQYTQY